MVVTGTAVAGKVKIGDEFYLSSGQKVRIKQIHAQNQPAEIGTAGQRLALNLANAEKEQIQRGDWITELKPQFTDRITVKMHTAQNLKENHIVHLYHFASHVTGKLNLLTEKQAVKNSETFAEIIFDAPLAMTVTDKLIIRSGDDSQTLAGAEVLEIDSPKRYKRTEQRLALVKELAKTTACVQRIPLYLKNRAEQLDTLLWREQCFTQDLAKLGFDVQSKWIFTAEFKQRIQQSIIEKLTEYHQNHNDQLGVTKARLYRIAALDQPEQLAYQFIDDLIENKQLAQTRGWVHLPNHRIEFSAEELQLWQQIRPLFESKNEALWVRDIATELCCDETEMRNLLYKAGKLGYLIPIVKDRFLLSERMIELAQLVKEIVERNGSVSVNQLRDEIQWGRKLTVQLIEYFDRSGFLRRKGNIHLLRDQDTF